VLNIFSLAKILLVLAEHIMVPAQQIFILVLFLNWDIDFGLSKKFGLFLLKQGFPALEVEDFGLP
jgi:hypothetical protein